MDSKEQMESWRVALISVLCTLVAIIMIILISAIVQSGVIEVIKEDIIDDYCSSIPLTEARYLEVCND